MSLSGLGQPLFRAEEACFFHPFGVEFGEVALAGDGEDGDDQGVGGEFAGDFARCPGGAKIACSWADGQHVAWANHLGQKLQKCYLEEAR